MRNYRGLTKEGKWVYGWYMEHPFSDNPAKNVSVIIQEERPYEVIPKTVGQQTDRKDKNDKEIYEGDIIEAYSETINIGTGRPTGNWKRTRYTIEWKAPMFTKRRHENNYLDAFGIGSQELITKYYEIIGNVHDNPELLNENN